MKLTPILFLLLLVPPGFAGADEESVPAEVAAVEPAPEPENVVASAIALLASDEFHKREEASRMLWNQGEEAVEALAAASKSTDPEVAYRARILWDRIRTGIGPDTPEEIVELVQKYNQGNGIEKRRVLESLKRARAYPQVLRLYHFEEDEAARRQCLEVVNSVVTSAVQEALVAGDNEGAISFLRISPKSEENDRRLAALYRETGQLEEIITSLQTREDAESQALLLACYRAKGDLPAILELARTLGRRDVVGTVSVLQGNPVPYLDWRIDTTERDPVVRLHMEIALEKWKGQEDSAAKLAKPMTDMAKEGFEESPHALNSLLLNGYFAEAAKVMREDHPLMMFSYHETMEQPWKGLEQLGYSRDKEAGRKWREERLKAVSESWDFYSTECHEYLSVAGILYQRGNKEDGTAIVRDLMEAARAEGGDPWQEFLGLLGERAGVFYEIGFRLLETEIGPETEELDVLAYVSALLGEGDGVRNVWNYLGRTTDKGLRERFISLGKIYGVVPAPAEEVSELWTALMDHAGELRNADVVYRALLEPAFYRDDASAIIELLTKLADGEESANYLVSLANFHAFLHQWEKSEEIWSSLMGEDGVGKRYLGSYAAVLLRVGKVEEAEEILANLDRGSLDEPRLLGNIAKVLESNGQWDRAASYWYRVLLTSGPPDWHWNTAVERYIRNAKNTRNWKVAGSLSLVHALDTFEEKSVQSNPVFLLRKSFYISFYQAMEHFEQGNQREGERLLEQGFKLLVGDGLLADDFFPILREAGQAELHDRYFEKAYARMTESLRDFPRSHNTHNGAAWLASRAARRLDEAEEHAKTALSMRPRQAAYLDTMAEVWFARHNREEAVKWSTRALRDSQFGGNSEDAGAELRAQHDRFLSGPLPVK